MKSILLLLLICAAGGVLAEPYLAVQTGYHCGMCHTNPTGGGKRTEFGNIFAQQQLAARPLAAGKALWLGKINDHISVGGNARFTARQTDFDDRDDNLDFAVHRVTAYFSARLSEQVELYIDQQVAPGGSLNREVWARFSWDNWYVKAGKLFIPFGWRLEDDTAFTRQVTGINFNAGDSGAEIGYLRDKFNFQLAVTNGNGGASDIDDNKLVSARAEWIEPSWRGGISAYNNNTDFGERTIYGLFAGVKLGMVNWLLEYDHIKDTGFSSDDQTQDIALIEANILLRQGHNLKLTLEALTFDDVLDDRYRWSAVYEYFPWAFSQIRAGIRQRDSDDKAAVFNSEETFLEIHTYF
jgi:hypothetical protein